MSCCCPPSCAIPSCPQPCCSQPCCSQPCCSPCSYPTGGLGKLDCCSSSCCCSSCCGNSTSARCLGITSGANVSCVSQIPPSEVVIQPPPVIAVIPGPVLLPPVSLSAWEATPPAAVVPLAVASAALPAKLEGELREDGNETAT
ncbi:LOW QUALITY PROTEIN: keratin-associated protein 4-8-like [Heteronotia binoei]|uniref:LOW QUALITY PROTEIN: keratin-associated protein 4-8-like n=1 Tax=Heteronotia binoei TaxID=13085 RepID=UPI00292E9A61|nr:LOW QUALITY PROTEIN: keratin-associated protein 4-8-like [Heteronotia binoei]